MLDADLDNALADLYVRESEGRSVPEDVLLRKRCRLAIQERLLDDDLNFRRWLSILVRDLFLSESALARGAGIEDACEFWQWFDQRMWPTPRPEGALAAAS